VIIRSGGSSFPRKRAWPAEHKSSVNAFDRGLIYTVDPHLNAPLEGGREYRIVSCTRFRCPKDEPATTYEPLYRRAHGWLAHRQQELTCASPEDQLQTWIVSHGWFRMEMGASALAGAVVTLGVRCAAPGTPPPLGHNAPTAEALGSPYVELLGGRNTDKTGAWFDEFYNDFDMRLDRAAAALMTVSYGEYVDSPDVVDFDAAMARAEHRARTYIRHVAADDEHLEITGRDWTCLDTGKSAKPFLAHVNLVFANAISPA